ncbi:MAG TPA: mechanosensitive ion channel domain-containing protein [Vicinamibacterales bacterium]|nr:mechanosensitive ion channel domain-containing protein [Vicinamibacterales bacterium]
MSIGARVRAATVASVLVIVTGGAAAAQTPPPAPAPAVQLPAALDVQRVDQAVPLVYFNRPIIVFRSRLLGRSPADRAAAARHLLDDLVAEHVSEPVEARPLASGMIITVASRPALVVPNEDVDELAGETLESTTAKAVAGIRLALAEAVEAHAPLSLLRSAALASLAIALAFGVVRLFARARHRLVQALLALTERRLAWAGDVGREALHASRAMNLQEQCVRGAFTAVDLVVLYLVTSFVLREFPYTRPWGESMRGFLVTTAETLAVNAMRAMPGLFTVALVVLLTRFVVRAASAWLTAVEKGRAEPIWIHPETAQATRRLVVTLMWAFAAVVAYPYMPGSQTDAFKGVSVFLGLMVTFGSSGLVNQIMSGFMITYSRALRVGDFVRVGEIEGTVVQLGVLSTKIKSLWHEDITIPNAVVVSQTTVDYSRTGDNEGVYTPTSITIGYDAAWRQVHALLLLAAERTPGIRTDRKPMVLQESLQDFYVKYTLLVSLERQQSRPFTLNTLHANIQDAFNEAGVQIMSPNYMLDPAAPKIVPKERWDPASAVKT